MMRGQNLSGKGQSDRTGWAADWWFLSVAADHGRRLFFGKKGREKWTHMEAVLQVQRINFICRIIFWCSCSSARSVFLTVRTRFVQVRCFGEGMRSVFGEFNMRGGRQKGGLSSFQALTTAIAAQVGTGNIIGACSAILLGGPGAIFWMWIIAFFRDVHHLCRSRAGARRPRITP